MSPSSPSPNNKAELRAWGKSRRAALSSSYRSRASRAIVASLRDWLACQPHPLQLLLYRAVRDEVDTASLFHDGVASALFAPRVAGDTMAWWRVDSDTPWQRGAFGVWEPQSDQQWVPSTSIPAIVIAPLTVFDRSGGRLGMGKGYFDRWLAACRAHLRTVVGLAFACQEAPSVPMEAHDQPLAWVITEKECIACRSTY